MPHVHYSAALGQIHQKIWGNKAFHKSMATWERRFYTVGESEVEGNIVSESDELPAALAAKYPDAEYRGEGPLTRTQRMG